MNFIEQPVTTVDCDVYEQERVILTCSVSSTGYNTIIDSSGIYIKWYFNNGTEHELMVGINQTTEGGNGERIEISSTLTISGTSQQDAANLNEGSYYCRVQMSYINIMSNSSQRFVVFDS